MFYGTRSQIIALSYCCDHHYDLEIHDDSPEYIIFAFFEVSSKTEIHSAATLVFGT